MIYLWPQGVSILWLWGLSSNLSSSKSIVGKAWLHTYKNSNKKNTLDIAIRFEVKIPLSNLTIFILCIFQSFSLWLYLTIALILILYLYYLKHFLSSKQCIHQCALSFSITSIKNNGKLSFLHSLFIIVCKNFMKKTHSLLVPIINSSQTIVFPWIF